jgi:hypothetical protein
MLAVAKQPPPSSVASSSGRRSSAFGPLNKPLLALPSSSTPNSGSGDQQQLQHQVKIAAINGKPRVQRYLSRECECFILVLLFIPFLQHFFIQFSLHKITR